MLHRSTHPYRHGAPAAPLRRPLPFFEFMLYGADAFAGAATGARLVPVTRGRSLTLIRASVGVGVREPLQPSVTPEPATAGFSTPGT